MEEALAYLPYAAAAVTGFVAGFATASFHLRPRTRRPRNTDGSRAYQEYKAKLNG